MTMPADPRQAGPALPQVDPLFERLLAFSHEALLLLSPEGRLWRLNAAAEALLGLSETRDCGRTYHDWPLKLYDAAGEAWGCLDLGLADEQWQHDVLVVTAAGERHQLRARIEKMRGPADEVLGWLAALTPAPSLPVEEQQRAAYLQQVINALPVGVVVMDSERGLVDANDAACALFGAPRGGLTADYIVQHVTAWYDAAGKQLSPTEVRDLGQRVATGTYTDTVVGLQLNTGLQRWLRYSTIPLAGQDQSRSLVVFTNCTAEQKEHHRLSQQVQEQAAALYVAQEQRLSDREALARYAAELRSHLDSVIEGVLVTDLDLEPLEYNARFCGFFGLPTRDQERVTWARHYALVESAFADPVTISAHVQAMFANPEAESLTEWELLDGRQIELHTLPVRERKDARIYGRIWVFRDVTARREDQRHAEQQAAFIQNILDLVPANIFVRDAEERYLLANKASARAYGVTVAQMLGHTPDELRGNFGLPPRGKDHAVVTDRQIIAGEVDQVRFDYSIEPTIHGHTVYDVSKRAFTWQDGRRVVLGASLDVTAQRRAEHELAARQQMLQEIIDLLPANVFIKDATGRYRVANKATAASFSLTVAEILGQSDQELASGWDLPPDRLTEVLRSDQQVLAGASRAQYELSVQDADGQPRHYFTTKMPFEYEGQPAILGVALDLTAQHEAAKQVAAQRAWFQQVIDEVPISIFARDAAGRYVLANRNMALAYHLEPLDLLGHTDRELAERRGLEPEWIERIERTDRELQQEGAAEVRYEFLTPNEQGGVERYLISKQPFVLADGSSGVLGVSTDITREAEADLTKQALEMLYGTAPIGIAFIDRQGISVNANSALARMMQVSDEASLVGINPFEHPLAQGTALLPDLRLALGGQAVTGEMEAKLDRGPVTLRYSLTPRRDSAGTVLGAQVIVEDITAYRHLQQRLAETAKLEALGQLAGGAAHSFRNMLTVINGLTEAALHNRRLSARLRDDLEQVREAGQRATDLARRMLTFSRRNELELTVFDLNALLRNLARMLPSLLGRTVSLEWALHDQPLLVHADRTQVEQMIINLAANARQAMPQGGVLTIATHPRRFNKQGGAQYLDPQPGRYVQLEVADTGTGLSPEARAHLFEPFFTTKPAGEGTGLGLSMAYGLMQSLGGGINVRSQPGRGTHFWFYLPRISAQEAEQVQSASSQRLPRAQHNELVLVVDGDHEGREALVRLLSRQLGYTVFDAADGAEALEVCDEICEPLDLVLSEAILPRMTGPELVARIGTHCPVRHVLYATSLDPAILAARAGVPAGAAVLTKPYDPERVARAVRAALEGPPLQLAPGPKDGQDAAAT